MNGLNVIEMDKKRKSVSKKSEEFKRKWGECQDRISLLEDIDLEELNTYKRDIEYSKVTSNVSLNTGFFGLIISTAAFVLSSLTLFLSINNNLFERESISTYDLTLIGLVLGLFFISCALGIQVLRAVKKGMVEKYDMALLDYQSENIKAEIEYRRKTQKNPMHHLDNRVTISHLNLVMEQLKSTIDLINKQQKKLADYSCLTEEIKTIEGCVSKKLVELRDENHKNQKLLVDLITDQFNNLILNQDKISELFLDSSNEALSKETMILVSNEVKSISQLSNHLKFVAFNASIEAAKSGKEKEGLAIIAKQMQELSEKINASINIIGNSIVYK